MGTAPSCCDTSPPDGSGRGRALPCWRGPDPTARRSRAGHRAGPGQDQPAPVGRPGPRGRLPRAGHRLPRDLALRRGHRHAGARPVDRGSSGEGAGELSADRGQPGLRGRACCWPSGPASQPAVRLHLRKGIPVAGGLAGGSADAAAALVACDALWGTGLDRGRAARARRRARQRRAVRAARRHRARHRPGRAAHPGAGRRPLALGGRGRRRRPVDPGRSTASSTGCAAGAELPASRRAGPADRPRCGSATRACSAGCSANDLQAAALRAAAGAAPTLRVGGDRGALGAVVSGSGPTCVFLARSRRGGGPAGGRAGRHRRLPYGPGRVRPGAGRPGGRRRAKARDRPARQPGERGQGVRDGTVVLADVSLGVAEGDRIGVVGRNGDGKTTLLRLLAGAEEPDAGRVTRTGGLRVGVPRPATTDSPPGGTVRDAVLAGGRPEHEWAGDAGGARRCSGGLGAARTRPGRAGRAGCPAASGAGSRWPRLLVAEPDLLVLDEPTNHLDVEGVAWLAAAPRGPPRRRSSSSPTTAGSSTRSARATWEVGRRRRCTPTRAATRRTCWPGPSATRQAAATEARRQNLLRKELAWLRRGPPARTSKPKFRIDAANALIADEPPAARRASSCCAFAAARLGKERARRRGRRRVARRRPGAARPTSPGGSARATGSASSASTAPARRRCCGCSPATLAPGRRDASGVGQTVRAGYLSQDVAEPSCPASCGCWRRSRRSRRTRRRSAAGELTAAQLAERFGFTGEPAVDPGRRPVRRRAAAAAAAAAADGRAQRAAARRADQRPRHRHAHRARGPARRLAGHARRRQPRPLLPRAGLRHGWSRCSATARWPRCPAGSTSTWRAAGKPGRTPPGRRRPAGPRATPGPTPAPPAAS